MFPITVASAKVVDYNLVLQIQNAGGTMLRLDGVNVDGTNLPIYPYSSGDSYGPAYCSRPNDNFSAAMSCSLMLAPGEVAYVAAQGAVSGVGNVIDCGGKTSVEISNISFRYSLGDTRISNIVLKGDKPILASCGTKACDANWSKVSGNSSMLVNDFCVMAYEATCSLADGGQGAIWCPLSDLPSVQPANLPWVKINQSSAAERCAALGAGYHLIRDREWIVAASNIANVAANWNTSVVGSGSLKIGNNGVDSSVSYDGPNPDAGAGNPTAQLFLSNGESLWHFSANVLEWTDDSLFENRTDTSPCFSNGTAPGCQDDPAGVSGGMPTNGTVLPMGWYEYTSFSNLNALNYSNFSAWTSAQGIGQMHINEGLSYSPTVGYVSTAHSFIRGGHYNHAEKAGILALFARYSPSYYVSWVGFRCAR